VVGQRLQDKRKKQRGSKDWHGRSQKSNQKEAGEPAPTTLTGQLHSSDLNGIQMYFLESVRKKGLFFPSQISRKSEVNFSLTALTPQRANHIWAEKGSILIHSLTH
jgi:hypothetical protein